MHICSERRAPCGALLPLVGTTDVDINYILRREKVSIYRASVAASGPARIAHEGLARAYGTLLAEAGFPHRTPISIYLGPVTALESDRWMDDGGPDASRERSLNQSIARIDKPGTWQPRDLSAFAPRHSE